VNCNTYLKFDHLISKMKELDCDYLATGHYAKIEERDGRPVIVTSTDDWKDQTYFLFTIDPSVLGKLIFPIGHLKKDDVRKIAEEKGLINARKKDSQGICFVGNGDYADFISKQVAPDLLLGGHVRLYPSGEIVAQHRGVHAFTLGQRKGLGFALGQPMFVIKIDTATRDVWVGEEKYLFSTQAQIENAQFLDEWKEGETYKIKVRYHHKGSPGRLRREGGKISVEFDEPVRAITPGQAAVVYRGSQLVGGGWIV
jgi:tRNA-specific 2-thiouridylase